MTVCPRIYAGPKVQLPSLCKPLPGPLSAAIAEAKRRCDGYQRCANFAVDTDFTAWRTGAAFKFFTSGEAGFAPAPDGEPAPVALRNLHIRRWLSALLTRYVLVGTRLAHVAEDGGELELIVNDPTRID